MALPEKLGKYLIKSELGHGAMGVVYRGYDPFIEREVAVKTLRTDALDGREIPEVLARFQKEAKAAGRLNHPNIVQIYEYGEEGDQAFIAMEIVQGVELRDYLEENARFSLEAVVAMMCELLEALGFAHRHGVVHRDIKPGNIVVLPDGHIKIMDFGIARLESSTLTQAGTILGTPSYMSPEQFMAQRVDGRTDLFAAGAILYELLTGEKAFAGNAYATIMHKVLKEEPPVPSALNVLVTPAFDEVVRKALRKRPDERFQSAAEFIEALRRALAGESLPAAMQTETLVTRISPGVSAADATLSLDRTQVAQEATVATAAGEATRVSPGSASSTGQEAASMVPAGRAARKAPWLWAALASMTLIAAVVAFKPGQPSLPEAAPSSVPPPPAARLAASIGWAMVESEPSGAVVTLADGGFGGVTPARLELPAGTHHLRVRKEGFQDWEASIEITAGEEVPLDLTLSPAR